ncbi:MAG: hypothetical protein M1825_003240 [Sarcosagium campestre]|nr:MAG: hypothetical protein M1825_003240 [Sarcosagium campestre]
MSLVVVDEPIPVPEKRDILEAPPKIAVTPCDPWPRPYYLEDGLRRVLPYHFTYNTNCKQRWRGRELLDVFSTEFRDRPLAYYKDAISRGMVTINGQPASADRILKNGDVVSHTLHRHEPPVTAQAIGIVHEDEGLIVINKPAGVPVHPAGRYNYNSLVEIMRAERGMGWNPLPCNRLDRLTSGIMFIGKHPKAAKKMALQINARTVRKEYIARVRGRFSDGEVECAQPILAISPKLGLNRVRANGKDARTLFRRMAYYPPSEKSQGVDEGSPTLDSSAEEAAMPPDLSPQDDGYSIVRCLPLTGRTHQIRVHLQYLGHPISNDPIYSNSRVFGPDLGREDSSALADDDIITRLSRMGKDEVADAVAYHDERVADYEARKAEKLSGRRCDVCDTELYDDPGVHELGIYLHSQRYACMEGNWSFETPLPLWALPPEGHKGPLEPTADTDMIGPVG